MMAGYDPGDRRAPIRHNPATDTPPRYNRPREVITRAVRPAKPTTSSQGLPLDECEFCREPIVWAETWPNPNARTHEKRAEVKLVPIDPEPSHDLRANLVVTVQAAGRPKVGEMKGNQAAGYRDHGGAIYIRHAKTCTRAADLVRNIVRRRTGK